MKDTHTSYDGLENAATKNFVILRCADCSTDARMRSALAARHQGLTSTASDSGGVSQTYVRSRDVEQLRAALRAVAAFP